MSEEPKVPHVAMLGARPWRGKRRRGRLTRESLDGRTQARITNGKPRTFSLGKKCQNGLGVHLQGAADTGSQRADKDNVRQCRKIVRLQGFELAQSIGCQRLVYRECISAGTGVVETANSHAANEINHLVNEVLHG